MRLKITDYDVAALPLEFLGLAQHLVGLADARGIAQEDFEFSALPGTHRVTSSELACGNIRTSIPSASLTKRSTGLGAQIFHFGCCV